MKKNNFWWKKFNLYQIVAVILVLAMAGFLGSQWIGEKLNAAADVSKYTVTVALTDEQPELLSQAAEYQKVAQFQFTTDSPKPVAISALRFDVLGGIKNKIFRWLNLLPLSLLSQSEIVGIGEGWTHEYGLIEQVVVLSKPLTVVKDQPVVLDVYTDLSRQINQAFGLDLVGVDSPLLAEGIPVQSIIYKIKR